MKTFFKVVTLAVALASSSVVTAAQDAQKIAVVFPSKIMKQSPQLEKVKNKLEAEFKDRYLVLQNMQKELTNLETKLKRDSSLMAASEVTKLQREGEVKLSEFNLKRKAFAEDQRRRQLEEQQKSGALIRKAIDSVANKKGYDLVLNGEQILFAKTQFDISDLVIKEISKK